MEARAQAEAATGPTSVRGDDGITAIIIRTIMRISRETARLGAQGVAARGAVGGTDNIQKCMARLDRQLQVGVTEWVDSAAAPANSVGAGPLACPPGQLNATATMPDGVRRLPSPMDPGIRAASSAFQFGTSVSAAPAPTPRASSESGVVPAATASEPGSPLAVAVPAVPVPVTPLAVQPPVALQSPPAAIGAVPPLTYGHGHGRSPATAATGTTLIPLRYADLP